MCSKHRLKHEQFLSLFFECKVWISAWFYSSPVMSENYIVFVEQPIKLNVLKFMLFKIMGQSFQKILSWEPEYDTIFHLVDRHTGKVCDYFWAVWKYLCDKVILQFLEDIQLKKHYNAKQQFEKHIFFFTDICRFYILPMFFFKSITFFICEPWCHFVAQIILHLNNMQQFWNGQSCCYNSSSIMIFYIF